MANSNRETILRDNSHTTKADRFRSKITFQTTCLKNFDSRKTFGLRSHSS